MINQRKRIDEIDIIKALGIICMVAGHSEAPFKSFIYLFHMAIFFIASGFFFRPSSSSSIKSVIDTFFKRLKQLWFPYFIWNAVYTLLNNIFIKINVYTDNSDLLNYVSGNHVTIHSYMNFPEILKNILKGALFGGSTEMGGAFWFLRVLFLVSVFYCICDYIIKLVFSKNLLLIQGLLSFGLLIFGYLCHLWGLYLHGLAQVASFYCLYFIGYLLSLWKDHYLHWKEKQFFILLASSFAFLLILNRLGTIALDQNSYCNPFYLLATSLTGWCFLFSLAYFITFSPFKKYLLQIGKQTLIIVILHFLSFKLVAALVVKIYNLPNYCMAAFPCLYGNRDLWWLAYTIVGVIVPLMLNFLYRSCTKKLKSMLLN